MVSYSKTNEGSSGTLKINKFEFTNKISWMDSLQIQIPQTASERVGCSPQKVTASKIC